jgi:hypothetical protein
MMNRNILCRLDSLPHDCGGRAWRLQRAQRALGVIAARQRVDRVNAIGRSILEKLLHHAASAAQLAVHLDSAVAVRPLADHVDALVHDLSKLLGEPRPLAVPMLASSAGGAP